jgi:GAF domain-containing protein/anti-sigma regulatory factor (Ser/Thr protein kinase)
MAGTAGYEPRAQHGWTPYVVAVALAVGALGTSRALAELTDRPIYAVLVAAVAISLWQGGLGPGLVTLAVNWSLAPFVVEANETFRDREASWTWSLTLASALAIVWVAVAMRRGQQRAATAAVAAESSSRQMESLQQLASALVRAVEPPDVARELLRRTPEMIGARGGSLGLVDGKELVIVDPGDIAFPTHRPGIRLPLGARAPITAAAATGELQRARSRQELETSYPDGAALAPYAQAALAVPLCIDNEVVASLSMLFDQPGALHEEIEAIALIAADLGAQALERAGLYERERQSREAFDRILRVAPRFHAGSAAEVAAAICREARTVFGSDFVLLWRLHEGRLSLLRSEPSFELRPSGIEIRLDEFPGLAEAVDRLQTSFIPDVLAEARGDGLELARDIGIRSSFRIPVSISGSIELVLSVAWGQIVTEPDASTVVLARRFADQAGLALEQLERRNAQLEAARRAGETRRLLNATAALAAATTPAEVTSAILEEGVQSLGAAAGVVVRRSAEPGLLDVVDSRGYRDATIDPWRQFPLDAPVPIAEAVRENELIVIEDIEELTLRYPALARDRTETTGSWLVLPLGASGAAVGAAGFSFAGPQSFSSADLEFAEALARQSGQALDRALLLAAEYDARTRAEDLVLLASALSQAVTPADVVNALGAQLLPEPGLDLVAVYMLDEAGRLDLVQTIGRDLGPVEPALRHVPLEGTSLPAEVTRLGEAVWLEAADDASNADSGLWASAGIRSLGAVPLLVDRRPLGVLVVGSSEADIGSDSREVVELIAQQSAQPLERAWLMDRERAARVQAERASTLTRRLQSMTQSLAAAATPVEVAAIVVREARDALSADAAALIALDRGQTEPELLSKSGLDATDPLAELTGLIVEAALAGSPLVHNVDAPGNGLETVVSVPVTAGTRVLGAVVVGFSTHQPVAEDDMALLETVARIGGQALERSRLLDEEQRLRLRSERIQSLTAALSGSLTQRDVAEVVVEALVQGLGASASALSAVVGERGIQEKLAWRGYDDETQESWREVPLGARTPGNHALNTRAMIFYESLEALAQDFPESAARMHGTEDAASFLFVPLIVSGVPNGLVIVSWDGPVDLSEEDRVFIGTVASQAAQALDRARHFESERTIAETLQRSVLPASLPHVESVQLAARYLPGTEEIDVGGDWYDAIQLPDGRLGLAVGDVVGKGVQSAATMAQLRNGLRAFALDQMKPSSTVARLNRLAEDISDGAFATIVYAVLDHETGVCRLTSAGHPPPLVILPDGRAEFVEGGRGLPLGIGADHAYRQAVVELAVGSTLLFYSDGLVERRSEPIDAGLEKLRRAAEEAPSNSDLLVEHVLERLVGNAKRGDDIVVLAVRLLAVCPRTLELELPACPRSLDLVRDALRVWLQRAPLNEEEAYDVVLATWEACANAIEHPTAEDGTFLVRAALEASSVAITVEDPGPWRAEAERAERGLGLRLMRSLMSAVEVGSSDRGTVVRLEKALAPDDAALLRATR